MPEWERRIRMRDNSDSPKEILANLSLVHHHGVRAREIQFDGESYGTQSASVHLPFWVWALTLTFSISGIFSANPFATAIAIFLLPLGIQIVWRRGEAPVLVFVFAMQWLQACMSIFYADLSNLSLELYGGKELQQAVWLTLIAVFVLALGMRIGCFCGGASRFPLLVTEGIRLRIDKIFVIYLFSFAVSSVASIAAFRFPGITQLIFAFTNLKWIPVFLLGYCVLEQHEGYGLLSTVVILEFCVGLLGFFSAFKSVLLVLILVALASPAALKGKRLTITVSTVVILLISGTVWSAVKVEYRAFLNQDSASQEVLVPVAERVGALQGLAKRLTWDQFVAGLETMALRISYVHYFALSIGNVPSGIPHENGALWFGAIRHVFTPRILFPDKPTLNDSERTSLYTGIDVAGAEQGTSIGIGYVGESYIDFGAEWMFAPILLVGLLYGLIYRFFILRSKHPLVGSGIVTAILVFGGSSIDTSNIKLVGGTITSIIVMSFVYWFSAGWLSRWLRG